MYTAKQKEQFCWSS